MNITAVRIFGFFKDFFFSRFELNLLEKTREITFYYSYHHRIVDVTEGKIQNENYFFCDDGRSLPTEVRCDYKIDCLAGEDEENCENSKTYHEF